ncbi:PAS domain-containing sensor histidine kinase [Halosimplex salinum]|uniref:PAS domain-containing sensor histidine kinase n=1 Tax=Halosimplex salinum TaxID=1710538 RepID=UPI000F4A427F|nr:PAS domain-containing sensor histidine kinase [Halosimplex salinum]
MLDADALGVLVDHSQDKIALLDDEGTFTYVNAAVERILGHDPADLVGRNALAFIHPDDQPPVRAVFAETIESETFTETTTEYRFRAADGQWVWIESRMSNLTDSELDGYVVSSRDVSDRMAAEREREATAMRLEELAANSGDVLWMFTGDWSELLFVNPAYEDVYGMPVAELERDPSKFLETIHPDDVAAVEEAKAALTSGNPVDIEYRVNPERDYDVWVWVRGQPIREDGDVVRIAGFTRDVTERHRRERQLYVMDNLLRHNLRNDMNVILGAAEFIEDQAPELSEKTAVIRRTGDDLLATAEKERDIIDFLVGDPQPSRIDLVDAVDRAVETVREQSPAATVECSLPECAPVYALEKLGIAVIELVENAIRHSETERPTVTVAIRTTDVRTELTVADDCPPLPTNESDVLTGEHEMNDVYHSTGLGLWLVYWCVQLSNSTIDVERTESGNRVRIELPTATE